MNITALPTNTPDGDVIKQRVHFLHIGKTGGTSIKDVLKNCSVNNYTVVLHQHHVKLSDIPVGEKAFFFLRNPLQRFISAFYSRQRQGKPRFFWPWSAEEEKAFSLFLTPNQLAEGLDAEDIEYRQKAIMAMQSINHVKTSFFDWFLNEAYFKQRLNDILFIGFQEEFSRDFNKLKAILQLPEESILPDDDVKAHRNPATVDRQLSDIAVKNLTNWYKRDIDFYYQCTNGLIYRQHYPGTKLTI